MARYDAEIEVGIKPVVDLRGVQKAADDIYKEISKTKKPSLSIAKKASSAINALMASGVAESPTQGRMILERMFPGKISGAGQGTLRMGQNITSIEANFKRNQQRTLDRFEKRFLHTERGFSNFLESPTAKGRESLLENISLLEEETSELLKVYKKSGQKVPEILKDSSKKTEKWQKEILKTKVPSAGAGTANALLGKLAGLGSLATLADWVKKTVGEAFTRGGEDITEQLMYGENRDIALTRAYANLFKMDEKTIALPFQKALTYQARMKSRQLSESEVQGWARLGLLPEISSGRAAQNQRVFAAQLRSRIQAFEGNEAELMSILQMIGLSPELAKLRLNYTPEEIASEIAKFEPVVLKEKLGAMEAIEKGRYLRYGKQAFGAAGTNITSGFLGDTATLRNPGIVSANEKAMAESWGVINANPQEKLLKSLLGNELFNVVRLSQMATDTIITNNNTFNINGGDTEEVRDTILKTYENMNLMNLNKLMGNKRTAQ